jgi:PhnB protein
MSTELVPYLCVDDGIAAISFYQKAFGATEVRRMPFKGDRRLLHAELSIDGRKLYLADDFPEMGSGKPGTAKALGGSPVTIHLRVADCDETVAKATASGAIAVMPPMDMFWGDRFAKLVDPFGHEWSISSPLPPDRAAAAVASAKDWT